MSSSLNAFFWVKSTLNKTGESKKNSAEWPYSHSDKGNTETMPISERPSPSLESRQFFFFFLQRDQQFMLKSDGTIPSKQAT